MALITEATLLQASQLRDRYSLSYWDSLIMAAALAEGATIVYSEDMHSALTVEDRVRLINPFAA